MKSSYPNNNDISEMTSIAESPRENCPEPILLMIGGNPSGILFAGTYVFRRNQAYFKLNDS